VTNISVAVGVAVINLNSERAYFCGKMSWARVSKARRIKALTQIA